MIKVRLLGEWEQPDGLSTSVPVGGAAYYITAPSSLANVFTDPFHTVFYLAFTVAGCAMFSKAWMEVSGSASQVERSALIGCA